MEETVALTAYGLEQTQKCSFREDAGSGQIIPSRRQGLRILSHFLIFLKGYMSAILRTYLFVHLFVHFKHVGCVGIAISNLNCQYQKANTLIPFQRQIDQSN